MGSRRGSGVLGGGVEREVAGSRSGGEGRGAVRGIVTGVSEQGHNPR